MHLFESKPTLIGRVTPYLGSILCTGALFTALPFTQLISEFDDNENDNQSTRIIMAPPPNPPETPPVEEEEVEEEDIEMNKEMQKISLDQINMALNAGAGGMGGANSLNVVSFELSEGLGEDLIFEVHDLDEPPEPIIRIAPSYPAALKRKGMQGRVWLLFIISEDGIPGKARVVESPDPQFSDAALKAIVKWKFKPGKKDGKAVRTRVRLPLAFSLN